MDLFLCFWNFYFQYKLKPTILLLLVEVMNNMKIN
jgi:hypothetical protein